MGEIVDLVDFMETCKGYTVGGMKVSNSSFYIVNVKLSFSVKKKYLKLPTN